ncbi:type III-A CRISPR-associated protein Cas10/Csm1 [Desulfobacca acetoxidans]
MDETVLKIAMAAFFHDIGKFADRKLLNIPDEFIKNHADLYQPSYQGRYSHAHALYTAAFIELKRDLLPEELNSTQWGEGDIFINLAASHHKPETPMQYIITMADRVSSGWDRVAFECNVEEQIPVKDYQKTRLSAIFQRLRLDDEARQTIVSNYTFFYPLRALSPKTIFPISRRETAGVGQEPKVEDYAELFQQFLQGLANLSHRQDNLELWFEHFDSLMLTYTGAIPSARAGKIKDPDVSLYDHARTTAALAAAIYLYHQQTESLSYESIDNWDENKFLIVNGDFYGIQNFIFSDAGDTRRYRSKILRGRSFAVSMFMELAADLLCRAIGLPFTSILLNAAGKFKLIAPNTPTAKQAIEKVDAEVNDWLIKVAYGENAIGFSSQEASANDLSSQKFSKLWERLSQREERKKFDRIDLHAYSGPFQNYLDSFRNDLTKPLCPLCGKRPAAPEVENQALIEEIKSACKTCRDHIFLGANLVKKPRLAVTEAGASLFHENNRLLEPIFGRYQLAFVDSDLNHLARSGQLLKLWDLSLESENRVSQSVAVRFINGYVPRYATGDDKDDRITGGDRLTEGVTDLLTQIQHEEPKTLEHIAAAALNFTDRPGVHQGIAALGILKADVDYLGVLLACGLDEKSYTISRLATLSRQLHFYFSIYLPHLCSTDNRFKNVYTVFAGGDDLFLIGPWNCIIDLATHINATFHDYVCGNPAISLSAGVCLQKPHIPLDHLAETAEAALKQSKAGGRNSLTLFDETVTWSEMADLLKIKDSLQQWQEQKLLNKAMLYRFNELFAMAGEEKQLVHLDQIPLKALSCTKWRALLAYTVERNLAKEIKGDARRAAVERVLAAMSGWLQEYGNKFKIPLWMLLYDQR